MSFVIRAPALSSGIRDTRAPVLLYHEIGLIDEIREENPTLS